MYWTYNSANLFSTLRRLLITSWWVAVKMRWCILWWNYQVNYLYCDRCRNTVTIQNSHHLHPIWSVPSSWHLLQVVLGGYWVTSDTVMWSTQYVNLEPFAIWEDAQFRKNEDSFASSLVSDGVIVFWNFEPHYCNNI